MSHILANCIRRWMHRSIAQKQFLSYITALALALISLPLLSIQELDETTHRAIWLLGSGMRWIIAIILIIIVKLFALNASTKYKKQLYNVIGRNNNEYMDNSILLSFLLIILLSISETISFFSINISTVITPSIFFLVIELLVLWWLIRQILLSRLQRKKTSKNKHQSSAVSIAHDIDTTRKEREFKQVDKAIEWLFWKE